MEHWIWMLNLLHIYGRALHISRRAFQKPCPHMSFFAFSGNLDSEWILVEWLENDINNNPDNEDNDDNDNDYDAYDNDDDNHH